MSSQIATARGLIRMLHKESTAADAAAGLDNIVYRSDSLVKTAILAELAAQPLPPGPPGPNLELLLKRLQIFAIERLQQTAQANFTEKGGPKEAIRALQEAIQQAMVVNVAEPELEKARQALPAMEAAAAAAERERCAALSSEELKTPDEFLCPITKQLMTEPVIASDGQTYDRAAIDEVTPAPAPPSWYPLRLCAALPEGGGVHLPPSSPSVSSVAPFGGRWCGGRRSSGSRR